MTTISIPKTFLKYRDIYKHHPPGTIASPATSSSAPAPEAKPPSCGASPDFTDFFSLNGNHRSVNKEDQKLYQRFFQDPWEKEHFRGNYVELGAFQGLAESNSRFFESCLGWNGLLIEGNERNFEKLVVNRPNAHRMNFAPSCEREGGTTKFHKSGGSTSGVEGRAKTFDGRDDAVELPCGPLTPVLQEVFGDRPHIDFFSLDVEGAEDLILATIDFDLVQIDVFMIEVENNFCKKYDKCEVRSRVREQMDGLGYKRYEHMVRKSDVYVHPKSPFQLPW
eukprot:CAMPEP_0197259328 /NCGR_PEP_ID=MMETSP1429-20130617/83462_1 /TAXON_ID=49237 /ORGANISM="Chaetoceros  sp., Strain UNC1202" /LENGTH=278 /DNA_ID=CAMNT_0042723533 /DNA_START=59 /DNA_END=895 /DNA_ORIENTATION=-